jgi:hypothetical protein
MPVVVDFRTLPFDRTRVDASGRGVGRTVYWKLYAVENVIRVIVHSILTAQIGTNWWATASDARIQGNVRRVQADYAASPWHTQPGQHEVYYTFLTDLNEIIRANSNLFLPVITDIDQWIARIEQVRLPRNVVGHMNWPSATDRQRIDVFYADIQALADQVARAGLQMLIP